MLRYTAVQDVVRMRRGYGAGPQRGGGNGLGLLTYRLLPSQQLLLGGLGPPVPRPWQLEGLGLQ